MTREPPAYPAWLARKFPDGMRRRMVDVGGVHVHVAEWGPIDAPPVLLLHGNPSWGFLWRKVVAALPGLRVVVPDLVGLGCSDKPRDPAAHTLVQHGRWMGALIDRLRLEEMVIAVQDWGGAIGLAALDGRIGRVRGMVLLNTVVGPPRPGFRPTAVHRFARMPIVSELAGRSGLFETLMFPRQLRAYRWPLRHLADRVAPLALLRMVPDSMEHPSIPALARCQAVALSFRGPMAIVWGDRDPVLGRVRTHLERLFPQAPVTRTQAGHFLQEEVPAEIAAAIRDVIARA